MSKSRTIAPAFAPFPVPPAIVGPVADIAEGR